MMDIALPFIIYATFFRLAIITVGIISIILGYRLFCTSPLPDKESPDGTAFEARIAGSHYILKNAAPGTFFALFGVIIISVMLVKGSPELIFETLNDVSSKNKVLNSINYM